MRATSPPSRRRFASVVPRSLVAVTLGCALVASACSSDGDDSGGEGGPSGQQQPGSGSALPGDDLRINEIQVIGSHNSYHLSATPEVANALAGLAPALWETVSYEHQPLTDQLEDHGIRQFELDVYPDPEGGLFTTPAALDLLELPSTVDPAMDEPGFKVQHIPDVDYRSTCPVFVDCLAEIEEWSSANPDHLPIMVMVETKADDLRSGDGDLGVDVDTLGVEFARPIDMTADLFDDLEDEVRSVFDDDRIIVPDDIRGDHDTLPEALEDEGWPTVADSRGKVMFSLVDTGEFRDIYTADAPNLEGRLFFTSSEPGRPDAAFLRMDDSLSDPAGLLTAAEDGYLIRTRTDEPGLHAPENDTTLRDSALASGAQYLSTDYYVPDPVTGYVVQLPDGVVARCNPVTAPETCDEVGEG